MGMAKHCSKERHLVKISGYVTPASLASGQGPSGRFAITMCGNVGALHCEAAVSDCERLSADTLASMGADFRSDSVTVGLIATSTCNAFSSESAESAMQARRGENPAHRASDRHNALGFIERLVVDQRDSVAFLIHVAHSQQRAHVNAKLSACENHVTTLKQNSADAHSAL